MQRFLKKLSRRNEPYIFLVLLVLCVLIEVRSGQFFTPNNIVDKLSALVVPGIFAVGAFMVIVSGGMDVSFPALASLSAYATTKMLLDANYTGGIWLPILVSLAIGAVLGAFNGIFVGYFGLPALIVTLGSSSVFKGFMQGTLASRQLAVIPEGMAAFGRSAIFVATNPESGLTSRMPMAFLVFVAVVAVAWFILNRTMFGRGIYAIGGNEVSAHRAGFSVRKTKFWMYVFVGMIASLAGLMRTCMMTQMHPTNMLGMEMNIIAGVVLGGTAISGGAGTLTGCMLGTLLIVIVENSMILLGIPTVWKSVFVGALIIIGTGVSALQVARANRAAARKTAKEVA
ncbi:MAG TPA: ABC transporter permease [Candidatus Pullichristensenella stercorigallinarum]|uniref:ABC transporter permease n=1 Tax=Candidatus Pullichristensenella stercorigallinarum TaxID=2840909 RepID=A0A9D0ZMS8_9FIRM|nr:ABC transporter permease [Candidatus Pullichristensenella stercorigallinarum]